MNSAYVEVFSLLIVICAAILLGFGAATYRNDVRLRKITNAVKKEMASVIDSVSDPDYADANNDLKELIGRTLDEVRYRMGESL